MQLTSKDGNMVVDFYPVKFNDGTLYTSKMLKVLTFMGETQTKVLINKKDFQSEVDSRVNGYGYQVTGFNVTPQLQGGLGMCCWGVWYGGG